MLANIGDLLAYFDPVEIEVERSAGFDEVDGRVIVRDPMYLYMFAVIFPYKHDDDELFMTGRRKPDAIDVYINADDALTPGTYDFDADIIRYDGHAWRVQSVTPYAELAGFQRAIAIKIEVN